MKNDNRITMQNIFYAIGISGGWVMSILLVKSEGNID